VRPKKSKSDQLARRITFRIGGDHGAALDKYCEENGLDQSSVSRHALIKFLQNEGYLPQREKSDAVPAVSTYTGLTAKRQ